MALEVKNPHAVAGDTGQIYKEYKIYKVINSHNLTEKQQNDLEETLFKGIYNNRTEVAHHY